MRFGLGQSATRVEDQRFLTGKGHYSDDINLPNQVHAAIVRSPHAHARIVSVDTAQALAMDGVLCVLTGADARTDNLGTLPCAASLVDSDGKPAVIPSHPVLLEDVVRYVGDYVAMVVAETRQLARDALEFVHVEYEELAPVATQSAALGGQAVVWAHAPDNIAFEHVVGDHDAVTRAFSEATHVTKVEVPVSRVAMCPMEPRAVVGNYDKGEDRYTLYSGAQNPHDLRSAITKILGINEQQLRYVSPDMGGGFGMRSNVFPELVLVLWASKRLGRPVKWLGDRSEAFLADDQGRDVNMSVELALDEDANFRAIRFHSVANMGAYLCYYGPLHAYANLGGLAGPYRTPLISAAVRGFYTTTTPLGPYRGAGRPEASLAVEQVIDQAARELGIDRVELRRRNLIASADMPFQTGLQFCYDSGEFEANLDRALQLADYANFSVRSTEAERRGRVLGLGIVYTVEQSAGPSDEGAFIRFAADGSATIGTGLHSHGQGHETIFRQVVCETLGLDFEQVRYVQGDTDQIILGGGTGGSRSGGVGSGALLKASNLIIEKGKQLAGHMLEAATEDIRFDDGEFRIAGTDRCVGLAEVAAAAFNPSQRPVELDAGLSAFASFSHHASTFPNGCHACEVEIDPATGRVAVNNYVVVKDVGTVMNPMLLEGQLQGGIVQGFGQIVLEQVVWSLDGQPLSGSFMDYCLPRADEVPFCSVETNEVPTPTNPFGIKGAGEAGTVGGMSAVAAAVDDAVTRAGGQRVAMPTTPESIWRALR